MRKIVLLLVLFGVLTTAGSALAIEKSVKMKSDFGFEMMPMRAWVLPGGDGTLRSGYYEYFTVDIRDSDLSAEIEAPKYESVFPAGPDIPKIKSKKAK